MSGRARPGAMLSRMRLPEAHAGPPTAPLLPAALRLTSTRLRSRSERRETPGGADGGLSLMRPAGGSSVGDPWQTAVASVEAAS
jgi:hypothetical protein